ncbi:hypothetical protein FSP39_000295 [Pinctada imbricata]|uniref:IgGFc-binding protein N-terminal domain-containing protein n=1 Tax=Pinctada imbricata TaxID=66713 RepID=A0AA89CBR8_PINIB|nr:hypothetical protein FSP39_000295 [Pinctada imbricata]
MKTEEMLRILVIFCCGYSVLGATDSDTSGNVDNDRNGPSKADLLLEITSLRQLVNQESLYRQELERQVREFRQQMQNGYTPNLVGIKAESSNETYTCSSTLSSVMAKLSNIARGIEAKNKEIERITNMFQILNVSIAECIEAKNSDIDKITNMMESFNVSIARSIGAKNSDIEIIATMVQSLNVSMARIVNISQNMVNEEMSNPHRNTLEAKVSSEQDSNKDGSTQSDQAQKLGNILSKYGKGHMGKSFAIMVPTGLSGRNMPVHLIISTESNTQITMRSSYPGLSKVFSVTPPGKNLTLPGDFALRQIGGAVVQSRGIVLESAEYVSVYVFHEDGYVAIPARYFGTHYKSLTTDHGDSFITIMPHGGCASVDITSHMGKRFAIMVPPGKSKRYRPIQLIISSESNTQISMKSTYPGLIRVFNITPPGKNISIPLDLALSQSGIRLQSRGIILESTEYVSVYVFNEDGYFALPARYLGTYYKSMTTDHGRSFIAIMPYGGSARVQITSTKGISSRNITIPELWVYSFWSSSVFRNVIISSNQTIAVISGHYDPHKVNMKISKQILFDYIPPVQSWDTSFIIPYIQNTTFKYDFLYTTSTTKIYAIRNFTTSQETITLPYKYVRSDKYVSNFIETVQGKMAVVLWYYWGTVLNTFMCVIPSLSQFSNNYHFWTPFYANNNFLAAIIKEEDLPGLIVDNSNVSNPYMSHSVLTLDEVKYNILTIAVTHGWHAVRHVDPGVRFGLIMYGGDLNISYGLPLGLRMD